MDTRTHPSDGTLPRHTFHPIFLPNKKASTLQLKARNIYQKAINAGKWQNFAAGIGTGATYSTLHGLRWHPDWLTIIEIILFFINVTIFSVNSLLLGIKILSHLRRDLIQKHFFDPTTPLIAPLFVLNYGTICIGARLYAQNLGASPETNLFQVLFWSYLAFSLIFCGPLTFVWFGRPKSSKLRSFGMTGAFLFFPLMLVGTIAFNALAVIDPTNSSALSIWVLGYVFQGLGMAIAFFFTTIHFYRVIRHGFHRGAAAASTFISVGPPGFTALAFLQLGSLGREILPIHTPIPQIAADVIYFGSIPIALCFLGMALYCWVFALVPWIYTSTKQIMYHPGGAWPLVFPCTGFTLALRFLGDALDSPAFWILHALFTGYICLAFLLLLPFWLYRILVPTDPGLLAARDECFEEKYDHLDFWSSNRLADEAEHKYLTTIKNKARRRQDQAISVTVEPVMIIGFNNHSKGKDPITVDLNMDNHPMLDKPDFPGDLWGSFESHMLKEIDLSEV